MRRLSNRQLRARLLLAFLLLAGVCALAFGYYLAEARRLVGANYTAMVTDVVRAQEDPTRLRLSLDNLLSRPSPGHVAQANDLLWRIPLRVEGIRRQLERSDLPPADYRPLLEELAWVEARLPRLSEAVSVAEEEDLAEPDREALRELGMAVEESLAWAYSELNELLHQASADQRRLMMRLTLAVAGLLLLVLVAAGAVMVMLLKLHRQREAMRQQSRTDELTGLSNRRRLLEAAAQELERRARHGTALSLLLLDLDHFKRVNDAFGHPLGDRVLIGFAGLLEDRTRRVDLVVRLGGEEFAILVPDSGLAAARRLAERIRRAVGEMSLPGAAAGQRLTVSIGVAEAREGDDFDRLYGRADRCLYRAKEGGRDRVEG